MTEHEATAPREAIDVLAGPTRHVVAIVQAIGFPAAFCIALLWALVVTGPRLAADIVAAIREQAQAQRGEQQAMRGELQQIREAMQRLAERGR